jgi:hypothetical protein
VSETTILWIFGMIITLQTVAVAALGSRLWDHVDKCKDVHSRLAANEVRVDNVEKDVQGLRNWKHVVVDPYVPRAIDEHERRINRLDQKMDER